MLQISRMAEAGIKVAEQRQYACQEHSGRLYRPWLQRAFSEESYAKGKRGKSHKKHDIHPEKSPELLRWRFCRNKIIFYLMEYKELKKAVKCDNSKKISYIVKQCYQWS